MDFRKAVTSDIPHMIRLRKQQLIEEDGDSLVTDIDKDLSEFFSTGLADGSFISWLAVENGTIAATSGVCLLQWPPTFNNPSGRVAYVTNMYTVPECRRQGLASRLVRLILDESARRGYMLARLHASDAAASLYRKLGFQDSDGFMKMRLGD